MPVIAVGETVITEKPTIEIEELAIGDHTFQLEVEDDQGKRSDPVRVVVAVRQTRPTARLSGPEGTVELGTVAVLDGRASSAVPPSTLGAFGWTLVSSEEPNPDNP